MNGAGIYRLRETRPAVVAAGIQRLLSVRRTKNIVVIWCTSDGDASFHSTVSGAKQLISALSESKSVKAIMIDSNAFSSVYRGSSAFKALMHGLLSDELGLRRLILPMIDNQTAELISNCLSNRTTKLALRLNATDGCYVTGEGSKAIRRILEAPCIEHFEFDQLYIADPVAEHIAFGLKHSFASKISMRGNLSHKALSLIFRALETNRHVTDLFIEEKPNDTGLAYYHLANLLRRNCTIKRISLNVGHIWNYRQGTFVVPMEMPKHIIDDWTNTLKYVNHSSEVFNASCLQDHNETSSILREIVAGNKRLKNQFNKLKAVSSRISDSLWPNALELVGNKPDYLFAVLQSNPDIYRSRRGVKRDAAQR